MYIITGSSGMIGTALSELCLKKGLSFKGIDRRRNAWKKNINERTLAWDLIKPFNARIGETPDALIHLAANARVFKLVENPRLAFENFSTIFNALEIARRNDIGKFFFASSREVYGNAQQASFSEENAVIGDCESAYAASKIAGEALTAAYSKCYGIKYVIYRFSNVYGRYDISDRVIPKFIERARHGKPLTVYGRDKLLDFTYIDDAIEMIQLAMERFGKVSGKTYNVGTGRGTRLLDLAQMLKEKIGSRSEIIVESNRAGEVSKYIANITRLKSTFGAYPKTGIEEGLNRSLRWYLGRRMTT